jgi:GTPase
MVAPELARSLAEISATIQRQVGLLIDRQGHIREVIVGDAKSVFLPDLSAYRRGRDRLCGLRLIHTHLNGEGLSEDDLTDLALLRLDAVAAVQATPEGLPGRVYAAHLLPYNELGQPWEVLPPIKVHDMPGDFPAMIASLDEEFARVRAPRRANDNRDRAILILVSPDRPLQLEESMLELRELAKSAGFDVVEQVIQRRQPDPRYVLGKGRLQATVIKAMQVGAEVLVFDQDLTPAQLQALSAYTDLKVLDRTQVILDIFAQRAVTREGKIQVELAQLRYMLPKLGAKQSATAFSRLTGGIGGRGPGETKLEIDRRRAQDRIAQLEREVNKLGDRRRLRRSMRNRKGVPVVSIVGYTNAGKSTLLNNLTESSVGAQDRLFATLNPVSRRLRFPREREVVVTDTVGFIRRLPDDLKAAFRTTFEEIEEADLLIHVLDASSPEIEEHWQAVDSLLNELEVGGKPAIVVLNKTDRADPAVVEGLAARMGAIPLCALDRDTLVPLVQCLTERLWPAEADISCHAEQTK